MDALSLTLTIVKYGGSVIAAICGVYGTITDFREERGGKKVLTAQGYWGIALLVFSAALAISADLLKEHKDAVEAAQKKAVAAQKEAGRSVHDQEIIADLRKELQLQEDAARQASAHDSEIIAQLRAQSLLGERSLNPIKDLQVSYRIDVPMTDPKFKAYRERLEKAAGNLSLNTWPTGVSLARGDDTHFEELRILPTSVLYPQDNEAEGFARGILSDAQVLLHAYREPLKDLKAPDDDDLLLDLTSRRTAKDYVRCHMLWYYVRTNRLQCCVFSLPVSPTKSSGKIVAIPDLSGSQLVVEIESMSIPPFTETDFKNVRRQCSLAYLNLTMSGGRQFTFGQRDFNKYFDDRGWVRYTHTFAKSLEGETH